MRVGLQATEVSYYVVYPHLNLALSPKESKWNRFLSSTIVKYKYSELHIFTELLGLGKMGDHCLARDFMVGIWFGF